MDIETVTAFLGQYEWSFERVNAATIAASFESGGLPFLLVFQLMPSWLRLSVPAYMALPQNESAIDFMLRALRLNQQTRLVRLAIDERGDIILCADVYTAHGLSFTELETVLESLCYTAGALYPLLAQPTAENELSNLKSDQEDQP